MRFLMRLLIGISIGGQLFFLILTLKYKNGIILFNLAEI